MRRPRQLSIILGTHRCWRRSRRPPASNARNPGPSTEVPHNLPCPLLYSPCLHIAAVACNRAKLSHPTAATRSQRPEPSSARIHKQTTTGGAHLLAAPRGLSSLPSFEIGRTRHPCQSTHLSPPGLAHPPPPLTLSSSHARFSR